MNSGVYDRDVKRNGIMASLSVPIRLAPLHRSLTITGPGIPNNDQPVVPVCVFPVGLDTRTFIELSSGRILNVPTSDHIIVTEGGTGRVVVLNDDGTFSAPSALHIARVGISRASA